MAVPVAVALALFALLGVATATKPAFESKISIHAHYDSGSPGAAYVYQGRVRSDRAACERHRTVRLFNQQGSQALDQTSTDANGHWRITMGADGLAGNYWAVTPRREGQHAICKRARSRSIPAPSA